MGPTAGVPVNATFVGDEQARSLCQLRSDLHETTFVAGPALIGG